MPSPTTRYGRPLGLQAQAEEAANAEHNRRMAEIKALAPLLAQLDPHMPGLRALGLDINPDAMVLRHEHVGHRRLRVLRVQTGGLFSDAKRICTWLEALHALGFAEVSRDACAYPTALLRRGHLLLRVDALRQPPAATAAQPPATADSVRQAIALAQAAAATTTATTEQVPA